MRTIGFATSPGILRVVGIVPFLTAIVFTVTALWMLATMVVGVRQALDYKSTWRAVAVCLLGWIVQMRAALLAFAAAVAQVNPAPMAVQALYALQNGFMGAARSLLFYGEYSEERTSDPHRLLAHQDHRRARAVRHRRVAARGAGADAQRPPGALHRGGPAGPSARRPRPRVRQHRPWW